MPEPEAPAAARPDVPTEPSAREPWWQRHVELIVVILLGVVSVATAYTSFQSSLYGGASDDRISKSEAAGTEAESLYLEGNQQFQKDAQTIATLQQLQASIDAGDPYPTELRSTAAAVAAQAGLGQWSRWALAWQSAGRTPEPWLGPDILAVLDDLAASENADGVLVCACGFVADHLEVLYDLDIEARRHAEQRGLAFERTACVNDDAAVMDALAARVEAAAT